jgi:subtilisin family serine protease
VSKPFKNLFQKIKKKFMYLKKHSLLLFVSLFLTNIIFAQVSDASLKAASKSLSKAQIQMLQSKEIETDDAPIRVSNRLMEMYKKKMSPNSFKRKGNEVNPFDLIITNGNKIRVDILATSAADIPALIKLLTAKGITNISAYDNALNADINISDIGSLEEMNYIMRVKPAYKPIAKSGPVQSQADRAIRANIARSEYGVNGHGIKIGILSDSYNALGGASAGVASGELPGIGNPNGFTKPVVILKDLSLSSGENLSDEGRAMAEIVHDVAPGAEIYFYTAFDGVQDFARGIGLLADAGCKIIVDDVGYDFEPYFQDGKLAQAVDAVTRRGVTYFTSAGNSASRSYESNFRPYNIADAGAPPLIVHNFSGTPSTPYDLLPFFCPIGQRGRIVFQWSQPFFSISGGAGARSDFDFELFDNEGNLIYTEPTNQIGDDAVSAISFTNITQSPILRVGFVKRSGPNPSKIKFILSGAARIVNVIDNPTPGLFSGTISGQSNARSAISVGAANYRKTKEFGATKDTIQDFSSKGGTPILFNRFGGRTFDLRQKPDFVAADNGNTSFFINGFDPDNDGIPNFNGTSASAPHAAAVAALCLEASSCFQLSPSYVRNAFILNTNDMDDPETPGFDNGFDFRTGYGFIRADDILSYFDFCFFNKKGEDEKTATSSLNKTEILPLSLASVYPNPVTNELNIAINDTKISSNDIVIKILDISGKQIPAIANKNTGIIKVDVSSLNAGVYIAQISIGSKVKNLKFIKL